MNTQTTAGFVVDFNTHEVYSATWGEFVNDHYSDRVTSPNGVCNRYSTDGCNLLEHSSGANTKIKDSFDTASAAEERLFEIKEEYVISDDQLQSQWFSDRESADSCIRDADCQYIDESKIAFSKNKDSE